MKGFPHNAVASCPLAYQSRAYQASNPASGGKTGSCTLDKTGRPCQGFCCMVNGIPMTSDRHGHSALCNGGAETFNMGFRNRGIVSPLENPKKLRRFGDAEAGKAS